MSRTSTRRVLGRGLVPLVLLELALASCDSSAVRGPPELAQQLAAQYDRANFRSGQHIIFGIFNGFAG